ncbi:hypothetical protein TWF281_006664 [Arthrobotrys megalospora]
MAINESVNSSTHAVNISNTPKTNTPLSIKKKINLSDYPIHSICKINPKTQKHALYYMTVCAPKHKIGYSIDIPYNLPKNPSSYLFEKSPIDILKSNLNNDDYNNNQDIKLCSKSTANNMATLLNFFGNNIHLPTSKYPNARTICDKLVGSLDANCLSDDDLAIIKTLMEEDNTINRGLIAERVNDYVFKILQDSSFPEEVARSATELLMPQVVDILFKERSCI